MRSECSWESSPKAELCSTSIFRNGEEEKEPTEKADTRQKGMKRTKVISQDRVKQVFHKRRSRQLLDAVEQSAREWTFNLATWREQQPR